MPAIGRRSAAEALGTAVLSTTVIGSGIMADRLTEDTALALLANALSTGAILIVLITILAPLSGAHLNPVVTLVAALRAKLTPRDCAAYMAAQIAGALAGAVAAHGMFDLALVQAGSTARTGAGLWLAETIATGGLVLTILLSARRPPESVAWLVGLYITAAYWFTASTSFANPALTVARSVSDTFAGIRMIDAPAFILCQIAGAAAALALFNWLASGDEPDAARPVSRQEG
ncbi:MAG: aquaporin [Rhizobiaceae bacterium]